MRYISKSRHPFLLLILMAFLVSCVPQKRLRYLQHGSEIIFNDTTVCKAPMHIIQPNDLLHVQIVSMSTETSKAPGYDAGTNVGTEASVYLQGYPVEEDGTLRLPVLGKFSAKGQTLNELQELLTQEARRKISLDAEVFVRLLNFKITVLGEVKSPGVIEVYDKQISVLDAIAMAGDLSVYGNREKVMLVRDNNGSKEIHYLDLTQRELLNSPLFYLKNHDMIYVEALEAKTFGFGQVNWGLIFSALSSVIAILAIVYK